MGGDMTRLTLLRPRFVALDCLLQVREELLVRESLAKLRDDGLDLFQTPKNSPLVSKKRSSCRRP